MSASKLFSTVFFAILAATAVLAILNSLGQFSEDSEWVDALAAQHNLSTVEVISLQREGRLPQHRP